MRKAYYFSPEELDRQLKYRLVCECLWGTLFRRSSVQEKFVAEFDLSEREVVDRIKKKVHQWYLVKFPEKDVVLGDFEYTVWLKLIKFLVKHCTM